MFQNIYLLFFDNDGIYIYIINVDIIKFIFADDASHEDHVEDSSCQQPVGPSSPQSPERSYSPCDDGLIDDQISLLDLSSLDKAPSGRRVYVNGRQTNIGYITCKYAAIVANRIMKQFVERTGCQDSKIKRLPFVRLKFRSVRECEILAQQMLAASVRKSNLTKNQIHDDDVIEILSDDEDEVSVVHKPTNSFRLKPMSSLLDPKMNGSGESADNSSAVLGKC